MLIPQRALKIAVKGGWHQHKLFMFWKAKVKERWVVLSNEDGQLVLTPEEVLCDMGFWLGLQEKLDWENYWINAHSCFDMVLAEKDLRTFWESVLKN